MIALAFKVAALAGSEWSLLISEASHSPFSHVELWIGGPRAAATCWSSREFDGVSQATLDLTQPEWKIVELPWVDPSQELRIGGFCSGSNGKAYDTVGLLGYKTGNGLHDDHDVFCSEFCANALGCCAGLVLPRPPWLISPGDLYGLVTSTSTKVVA